MRYNNHMSKALPQLDADEIAEEMVMINIGHPVKLQQSAEFMFSGLDL